MSTLAANDPKRIVGLSPSAAGLLATAAHALSERQLARADLAFVGVLALAPRHPEVLRLLGVLRHLQGRPRDAVDALEAARTARPDDALIHSNLGSAYRSNGEIDAAVASLRQACVLAPELDSVWFNLGKTLKGQSLMEEARASLERAITCNPSHAAARLSLAETLKALGDIAASTAMYRSIVGNRKLGALAWYGLANLKTVRFTTSDAAAIQELATCGDLDDEQEVALGFASSKALDDIGDYAQAFAVLKTANQRKRRLVDWDAAAFSDDVHSTIEADATATARASADLGREVIFVVSLPRSGSTLTEQILAAHPMVEGAGELSHIPDIVAAESQRRGRRFNEWLADASPADWSRLGEDYLARTQRWRRERPWATDKGLNNWFHLAAIVRMLPAARVVICQRDPVETIFSCYRQLFAKGQNFAYDLGELASYWRDYQGVIEHFLRRYPSTVHRQVYEALLADPQAQTRGLLNACGLEFDPRCLRFHEAERHVRTASAAQVRQPLRRDTARAPIYGDVLRPIHDLLGIASPAAARLS